MHGRSLPLGLRFLIGRRLSEQRTVCDAAWYSYQATWARAARQDCWLMAAPRERISRLSRSRHKYTLQRTYLTSHAFSFCWFTPIIALPVHTHSLVFTHYGCCSLHCRRRGCRYIALFSFRFPALVAEFVCLTRGFHSAKDLEVENSLPCFFSDPSLGVCQ